VTSLEDSQAHRSPAPVSLKRYREAIPGEQFPAFGPGIQGLNVADDTLLVADGEALTLERGAELIERALVRVLPSGAGGRR